LDFSVSATEAVTNAANAEQPVRDFAGRTALVSGATSGIGRSIATALAARGADVCVVGRNAARLTAVAGECEAAGGRVLSCCAEFSASSDVTSLGEQCHRAFGRLDILVHSAAALAVGRIGEAPVADFDEQYRTNLRAPFVLTQSVLPLLRSTMGQVVFINSTLALSSKAAMSQYGATKHGLKALADGLREEVNADGIRVLSVYVGRTATPMQAKLHEIEGRTYDAERLIQPADIASLVLHVLALPRTIEVTDITTRPMKGLKK
jgi:NAD(P)-dependent dehydrogenase (short-subunit alcohol dehydrogenase family)